MPGSNEKALKKALGGGLMGEDAPDVVTLDLEDSVRTEKKSEARRLVREWVDRVRAQYRGHKLTAAVPFLSQSARGESRSHSALTCSSH